MAAIAMSQEEQKAIIPVLTVFKNNMIIKNIIICNNNNKNYYETLLVGRHPSCNIVLTHPSISRFHLNIRFTPSSRSISLSDLSSVHGTWVCGKKLHPGVSIDLKEGDTFTIGVSSRLYLLRFVSQFDELPLPQQLPQQHHHVEEVRSFSSDEERKGQPKDETSYCDAENKSGACQYVFLSPPCVHSVDDNSQRIEACPQVEMPAETNLFCTLKEYFTHNICEPVAEAVQGTKLNQFREGPDTFTAPQPSSVEEFWFCSPITTGPASWDKKHAAAVAVIPKESQFGCTFTDTDCDKIEELLNSDNAGDSEFRQTKVAEEVSVDSLSDGEKQEKGCEEYESKLHNLNARSCNEQGQHSQDGVVEAVEKKCIENVDPALFDENNVAAVTAIPEESEFGCTFIDGDADNIEELLNSDNAGDSELYQTKVVEEVSVDSHSAGENQGKCCEQYESKLHNLNARSCHEQGQHFQDGIVEDIGNKCIGSVDPASLDKNGVAAVTVISDFGCTFKDRDADKIEEVVEEATPVTNIQQIVEEVTMDSICDGQKQNECDQGMQVYINAKPCDEESNSLDKIVEDTVKSFQVESPNPSVPQEDDSKITNMKENQTPQSLVAVAGFFGVEILASSIEEETNKSSSSTFGSNSWSRRGKAASAPQDRTWKSRFVGALNVDTKVEMSNLKETNIINRPKPRDIFSVLDEEEEMFTPKKENSSPPNTFHVLLMKKRGGLEESKHSKSRNLKASFTPQIYPAGSVCSNKENQTPKLAQEIKSWRKPLEFQDIVEIKKKRVERVPLKSLMNSGGNRKLGNSDSFFAAKTNDGSTARASNCGQSSDKHTKSSHISEERMKNWDMVVDTAALLKMESRKALQLLQGLKGTNLIIPQSVIRELSSIKQQYRIFRTTSAAALALEWIEECMEKTKWWIHIQSSMETQTPPQIQFNAEDHILDCALQHRRKDNVGQIVLLSDNVTLKIKSMATGLLCETVEQFHQSLVNPFSGRFMWVNSSPRGLTWSCQDDVVLRERYCGLPSRAGLKLITQQFL